MIKLPLIYIAGPYTVPDPVSNLKKALAWAEEILSMDLCPIVPHLTLFWDLSYGHRYQEWLDLDMQYLLRCDAVFRFPGFSEGADKEMEVAKENNIPVFYSLNDLEEHFWEKV